jgi:hypothetical protein
MNNGFLPALAIISAFSPGMAGNVSMIFFLPDGCSHLNQRFRMGRGGHMEQQSAMAPHPLFGAARAPEQKPHSIAAPVGLCIWDRLDSGR